jgi:hypothetical protein
MVDLIMPSPEFAMSQMKAFKIIACPFPHSDATSEYVEYGKDEADALKQFRTQYPAFRVKTIEEI